MFLAFAIEAMGILLQAKYGQDPIAFLALFVPKPMREAHAKKYNACEHHRAGGISRGAGGPDLTGLPARISAVNAPRE